MASSSAEITTSSSDSFLIDTHDKEEAAATLGFPSSIPKIKVSDPSIETNNNDVNGGWSTSFHSRSLSSTPRSRPSSPRTSPNFHFGGSSSPFPSSRFSSASSNHTPSSPSHFSSYFKYPFWNVLEKFNVGIFSRFGPEKQYQQQFLSRQYRGKRRAVVANAAAGRVVWYRRKRVRGVLAVVFLVGFFFFMNWWMLSRLQDVGFSTMDGLLHGKLSSVQGEWSKFAKGKRSQRIIFSRMLALAAHALAEGEGKPEPKDLWEEPLISASAWTPCADQRNLEPNEGKNGYILVSANGGINQQRVAVCNIVALARLLNSTLVVPKFLFSSVWRDASQFSDIYQEDHFINYLKPDIQIVKELPLELKSLNLEAVGSIVTDADVMKEAKPSFYLKHILPIILRNRVVHFVGFGNRLAFDPVPFELQRLRCRCNFHALRFVPKIQTTASLLLQRMRHHTSRSGPLDPYLVGPKAAESYMKDKGNHPTKISRYLAVHLRFEIDMAAHSLCDFGGGEEEREELEAYRKIHFPALTHFKKTTKLPSPAALRSEGQCPLTPEEAVLMLAALGFKRKTPIYLAGAHIYGGKSRLSALTSLYPNLVTKESLLSTSEIRPFMNFSSQLAALDFIGCAAADAFAMTDSGSQLSSLVTGYRIYFGGGRMPSIRPNKRRLASIFLKNSTIEWSEFEDRVRKAVRQSKQVHVRPVARSVYRHPRCRECMCTTESDLI